MRPFNQLLDAYRVRQGAMATNDSWGLCGAFRVPCGEVTLNVISSGPADCDEAMGWEHVSVSLADRCPTWEQMCCVKDLFWRSDEWVMQLHPPAAENINHHPYCLHLWRPADGAIPTPPPELVGPVRERRKR